MLRRATWWLILSIPMVGSFPLVAAGADEVVFSPDGQWVEATAPPAGTPEAQLEEIRQLLREGKNRTALRRAERFERDHPADGDEKNLEQAMSLAAEAEMARGRYYPAFERYERQISRFPMGDLLERALGREAQIADAFLAGKKRLVWGVIPLGAADEGLEIHERIAERVPGTRLAAQSLMAVGDYQLARRRHDEAADAYDRYVRSFRGRYDSREAELKAARAVHEAFRGVQYDDTPLVDARQRYEAFAARHAPSREADLAAGAADDVQGLQARKDYETARFYERIGRSQSAAFYHREVVELHQGSEWAEKSSEALEELPHARTTRTTGADQ